MLTYHNSGGCGARATGQACQALAPRVLGELLAGASNYDEER